MPRPTPDRFDAGDTLWRCPRCERVFANRSQTHTCGLHDLEHHWLVGHVVLARRLEHPRFRKIETISARNHVHHFRLAQPADIDNTFIAWLREAYAVGEQRHLRDPRA